MRGKGTLSLLEQSVALLIFAVAAALCLKGFLLSETTARENALRDEAVLQARNVAEQLKYTRGEWDVQEQSEGCFVHVQRVVSEVEGLGKAEIIVSDEDGTVLICLPVAWQEVADCEG